MKTRSLLALIFLLPVIQSAQAQTLDLTKGYGKYTWGMSLNDALKIANNDYGQSSVQAPGQNPDGNAKTRVHPLPEPLTDQISHIKVSENSSTLYLDFIHDHLFQVAKNVSLPLKGIFTQKDLDAAAITDRFKAQVKAPKEIAFSGTFTPNDEYGFNGAMFFGQGTLVFDAINNDVFDKEVAKLCENNPDLDALFLNPVLTP